MEKMGMLNKIGEIYKENENIISYLKKVEKKTQNSIEDILISYDFQAGSYTEEYYENVDKTKQHVKKAADRINNVISNSDYDILEVGVGEATTLVPLLKMLKKLPNKIFGLDLSWSRIKFAKKFANKEGVNNIELVVGDMFNLPFADNSIDIVYTFFAIEPNGGKEKEALEELYRVASKYIILFEPAYEFASEEAKRRMIENGYVTKLYDTMVKLGYRVLVHELFDEGYDPLNCGGVTIIEKCEDEKKVEDSCLCCPITKAKLIKTNDCYYAKDALLAYPILDEIPCLLSTNAIVATKFL